MKNSHPKHADRAQDGDPEERPTLNRARLEAEAKRARTTRAYEEQLIKKFVDQLGLSWKDLEERADADFAAAKAESAERLKQLRANQSARAKGRDPLRARLERLHPRVVRSEVSR